MTGDPLDESFLDRIMQIESGGNPNARTGSYKGLFQLSDQEFNRYGSGNIYDPMDNRNAAIRKLEAERETFREKYGEEPSPTDLYMMHQQGEAGYAAHRANPDAPAWQNMASTGEGRQKGANWARQAIWGNVPDNLKRQFGSVDNVSSADFVGLWRNKVEGGAPASYDTEDRTAVGLGGSRAYAPETATVPDTGRRQMADQPRGIMDFLTGGQQQQQQPGGLLGMLGDPETMAYLAMIAKGASPYSNLDPNAMLSNAHTLAMRKQALEQQRMERMTDNARADRALGLRESEYGLQREDRQARDAALFEERQQKRDLATKQKEIDDEVRRNLGGGDRPPGEAATDGAVAAVPEGTRSAEDQIAQLNRELAKNPSPHIAKSIERRIEQLQKHETDKAIPAELAGRLGMADVYLKKAPEIAKAIDAGDLTGLIDQPLAKYGGALGGKSAEKYRDMQSGVDALTRMMTGAGMPAAEAESYANRYLPALTDNATSLRSKHDRLVEELQTIKATVEKGRIKSPGTSPTETRASPESGALPGGWTVKVK